MCLSTLTLLGKLIMGVLLPAFFSDVAENSGGFVAPFVNPDLEW